jgi:hypothetical protein
MATPSSSTSAPSMATPMPLCPTIDDQLAVTAGRSPSTPRSIRSPHASPLAEPPRSTVRVMDMLAPKARTLAESARSMIEALMATSACTPSRARARTPPTIADGSASNVSRTATRSMTTAAPAAEIPSRCVRSIKLSTTLPLTGPRQSPPPSCRVRPAAAGHEQTHREESTRHNTRYPTPAHL